ncbi:MAG: hypothetical protein AB7E32_03735 [Desulfovibrio sp.]
MTLLGGHASSRELPPGYQHQDEDSGRVAPGSAGASHSYELSNPAQLLQPTPRPQYHFYLWPNSLRLWNYAYTFLFVLILSLGAWQGAVPTLFPLLVALWMLLIAPWAVFDFCRQPVLGQIWSQWPYGPMKSWLGTIPAYGLLSRHQILKNKFGLRELFGKYAPPCPISARQSWFMPNHSPEEAMLRVALIDMFPMETPCDGNIHHTAFKWLGLWLYPVWSGFVALLFFLVFCICEAICDGDPLAGVAESNIRQSFFSNFIHLKLQLAAVPQQVQTNPKLFLLLAILLWVGFACAMTLRQYYVVNEWLCLKPSTWGYLPPSVRSLLSGPVSQVKTSNFPVYYKVMTLLFAIGSGLLLVAVDVLY